MPLASVLIVDDDEDVRAALRRELGDSDYVLHCADRPQTALEILDRERIDIVISDNAMPGMSGIQFLRVVRYCHPHVIRIMLTGTANMKTAIEAINKGEIFRFIEKPWEEHELQMVLCLACQRIRRAPAAS